MSDIYNSISNAIDHSTKHAELVAVDVDNLHAAIGAAKDLASAGGLEVEVSDENDGVDLVGFDPDNSQDVWRLKLRIGGAL